ncbi:MAG: UDP-N-acetylmuramate--L-alanine ligase [Chlamydiae bacterium]|nr:UDP-N-acetylmuramate--L-alanine ligase [Chlamydiota bacterium]
MHFIGIGGIGMSALAHIALEKGEQVSGSDAKDSAILQDLEKKGAFVQLGHHRENIQKASIVVYSSAIKEDNPEYAEAQKQHLKMLHRSDLLSLFMQDAKQIIVAGAHGKSTTTAWIAYALKLASKDPSFVVGGISPSLQIHGKLGKGEYFVAEGDESDGSFLRTTPFAAIITSMDPDHLDFWQEEKALDQAYDQFIQKAKHLIYCIDDPKLSQRAPKGISYGFSEKADIRLLSTQVVDGKQRCTFTFKEKIYEDIPLSIDGIHNVLNALAVFGLLYLLEIEEKYFFEAVNSFEGVLRRMQFKGIVDGVRYIDDYAHHPKEVEATLQAMRSKVPSEQLVVVFQPHRFSRFHTFQKQFAKALSGNERVLITDIYGAGEENSFSADPQDLVFLLPKNTTYYAKRTNIKDVLKKIIKPGDTVLAMGAGDITLLKKEME